MQARETGICPIREELYAQCFDELIRQVTINCAERGLLLLRVRDEMRMTTAAYQVSGWASLTCTMKSIQPEFALPHMHPATAQHIGTADRCAPALYLCCAPA